MTDAERLSRQTLESVYVALTRDEVANLCCRQRAYERRLLEKQKQAEADAANATLPRWATHLHVKPTLPPRRRPTRLRCPVCSFQFAIKKRGPISETCSDRCAFALALHRAYMRGVNKPVTLLKNDIVAASFLDKGRLRRQAIIDEMLAGIDRPKKQR